MKLEGLAGEEGISGIAIKLSISSPSPVKLTWYNRKSCVGDGQFFFAGQRVFALYRTIKGAMEVPVQQVRSPNQSTGLPDEPTRSPSDVLARSPDHSMRSPRSPVPSVRSTLNDRALMRSSEDIHSPQYTYVTVDQTTPNVSSAQSHLNGALLKSTAPSLDSAQATVDSAQAHINDATSYMSLMCLDSVDSTYDDVIMGHEDSAAQDSRTYDSISGSSDHYYIPMEHQDSAQTHIYDDTVL